MDRRQHDNREIFLLFPDGAAYLQAVPLALQLNVDDRKVVIIHFCRQKCLRCLCLPVDDEPFAFQTFHYETRYLLLVLD